MWRNESLGGLEGVAEGDRKDTKEVDGWISMSEDG